MFILIFNTQPNPYHRPQLPVLHNSLHNHDAQKYTSFQIQLGELEFVKLLV